MNEEYERIMIDDTYRIIIEKNAWPVNWTRARKIQLIDRMIQFYTKLDEYEYCLLLQKKREKILKTGPGSTRKRKNEGDANGMQ